MIDFEWDDLKATSNLEKHKVSFEEARSVFFDEYAQQFFMLRILMKKTDSLCLVKVRNLEYLSWFIANEIMAQLSE